LTFNDCYSDSTAPIYHYYHFPSGIAYIISSVISSDASEDIFSDFVIGIKPNLTDEGKPNIVWPWQGSRIVDIGTTQQEAGSFTLELEYLAANEPILSTSEYMYFTAVNDRVFISNGCALSSYSIGDNGLTLENKVWAPSSTHFAIDSDSLGNLYIARALSQAIVCDEELNEITNMRIAGRIFMHNSGEWGFSSGTDPAKILLQDDGTYIQEPWVLENLRDDATRRGHFRSVYSYFISNSNITVNGTAADRDASGVMIYDFNGRERFALEIPPDGWGRTGEIVETGNGFILSREHVGQGKHGLHFWNSRGNHIAMIELADLTDLKSPSVEDICLASDGSVLLLISQVRDDLSAEELLVFKLNGF